MRTLLLICFLNFFTTNSYGQSSQTPNLPFVYKNSVHTELLGNGSVYSFVYERVLLNGPKFKTTGQFGFTPLPPPLETEFVVHAIVNELISFNKHHIEIGLGYGIVKEGTSEQFDSGNYDFITGRLCYRHQKPDGRFTTKIGFTPFIFVNDNSVDFIPWGGISFGYNF
ncbi:MAG: hypothetical protein IPP71_03610 [Bacteroidetes bacterium]|nr:hypothetical protein [Bacteroidota bacterium]